MARQEAPYSKARRVFLVLFVVSTVLALGLAVLFGFFPVRARPGTTPSTTPPETLDTGAWVATLGSLLTSIVTLVGFVSTTILAWRKEAREAAVAELERKRQELELEKEKLELEKLRAEDQRKNAK